MFFKRVVLSRTAFFNNLGLTMISITGVWVGRGLLMKWDVVNDRMELDAICTIFVRFFPTRNCKTIHSKTFAVLRGRDLKNRRCRW